ncbi:MAG: mu-protocadherin- cell-suface protein, partial [Planctomycetota bacterium]
MGDFLGFDKPLRPSGPDRVTKLPSPPGRPGNLPNRPDGPGGRPGIGDRPLRPGVPGNRPGSRPNFDNRWGANNVINRRPGWANIDNSTNINIRNRWNTAVTRPGWRNPGPTRRGYWDGWANGVRRGWVHYHRRGGWYNAAWWDRHPHARCGWHYHYWRHNYGWNYWWRVPAWGAVTSWFVWQAPTTAWSEPIYYDYGSGGNVTYEENSVFIGGAEVATAEEFAQSAMDLATVEPPASEEEASEAEWLPL